MAEIGSRSSTPGRTNSVRPTVSTNRTCHPRISARFLFEATQIGTDQGVRRPEPHADSKRPSRSPSKLATGRLGALFEQ